MSLQTRMRTHRYTPGKQRGAASVEAVFIFGFLVLLIVACSDLLSMLRLQQRLDNLAYNLTQMATMTTFMPNSDAANPFTYYGRYTQQQLKAMTAGNMPDSQYGMSMQWRNLATDEAFDLIQSGNCQPTSDWPALARGIFVRVSVCLTPGEISSGSWVNDWVLGKTLRAGYVQEIQ
ncbi:tight adherence pilus pseudopilin TadF [Photobacterium galatheae]|uniref:Pilus assembly protein TadE n=1 Tax=Photobacterium galatheae TaxID=1654360 RepID=A0A066RQV5_9GAMM|nr:tight adherence pilus pseudopilin TadF [Photobacterium galatheae]KDM90067.1 hypothetical protein EA58_19220 [Photobacterium galatheae]MCM0150048.1 hypothetical protein [Photobacterium galatheae]